MKNKIIFLDIDGVVNTIQWKMEDGKQKSYVNYPRDGKVNNFNAICWLNEVYKKINYDIVITSTWRINNSLETLRSILVNSGLNSDINIIDKTPVLRTIRGTEIESWILDNKYEGDFVIIDDDNDMGKYISRLIICDSNIGITVHEYSKILNELDN